MKNKFYKLKNDFSLSKDYIFKEISNKNSTIYIAFNEVLTNSKYINDFILRRLTKASINDFNNIINILPDTNIKVVKSDSEMITYINNGFTLVFTNKVYAIETRALLDRGIATAQNELSIKGPKDAFSETFNINLGLIRRRIKSEYLVAERKDIGTLTKTNVGILYMKNIVEEDTLNHIKEKLDTINIDGIIDSAYLKGNLEAEKTFFPTVISTERPDKVSMALLEGKVAIITDTSPQVLIMPTFLIDYFHTVDDYYQKPINITFIRIIRLIAFLIAIFTPALYLAVITHNFDFIPLDLLMSLKAQRESVPFPALVEALLMSVSFEILRESDIRMSTTAGSAISILGGLILGDAAVSAGIISPTMIIVIAISAISGLMFSSIELVSAIRWWRFLMMFIATIFGLPGVIVGAAILFIRLLTLKSIKKPYLYPFFPFNKKEQKDAIIKSDNKGLKYRNPILTKNKVRGVYK